MKKKNRISLTSLEDVKDKHIGALGAIERDQYEFDLKVEILGELIRTTRVERKLTQQQLGDLIGVQKSHISKLERNTKNVTVGTLVKVFRALNSTLKFSIVMDQEDVEFV